MSAKIMFAASAALIALCGPAASSRAQELVQNGGFETGSLSGWTQFGDISNNGVWRGGPPYPHNGAFLGYFGPASTGGPARRPWRICRPTG